MKTGTIPICTWVGMLFLFTMLLAGCNGGKDKVASAEDGGGRITSKATVPDTILTTADLENPENPYRDDYREWDFWLVDHQVPEAEVVGCFSGDDTDMSMIGYLDEAGWLIPSLVVEKELEDQATLGNGRDYLKSLTTRVFAAGAMDPELSQQRLDEICMMKAQHFLPIPSFLGENPPRRTMLLSEDRFVTIGLPGSGSLIDPYQQDPYAPPMEALPFYLWDSQGNQLGESWTSWYELFGAPIEEILDTARDEGCNSKFPSNIPMGYLGFNDAATGQLKLLFDYDGTPLEPDLSLHKRDEHNFMFISANKLTHLYNSQQTLFEGGQNVE